MSNILCNFCHSNLEYSSKYIKQYITKAKFRNISRKRFPWSFIMSSNLSSTNDKDKGFNVSSKANPKIEMNHEKPQFNATSAVIDKSSESSKGDQPSALDDKDSESSIYEDPTITDKKDFEEKFWQEYQKKLKMDLQDRYEPYVDRIRYRKVYRDPFHRAFGILKDDILQFFGKLKYNAVVAIRDPSEPKPVYVKDEIFPNYCDVVIIGGGLVGTSIAFHLQERAKAGLRVVVVEKDLSYSRASSVLSVGGFRHQFSVPENITLSQYGMDFLKVAKERLEVAEGPPNIDINFNGYLTLASEAQLCQLEDNYKVQKTLNSFVKMISKEKLKAKFPWINTDGVEAGVYGVQREGWFDPWSFLLALNRKTRELGTQFVNGTVKSSANVPLGDRVMVKATPWTMQKVKRIHVELPNGEVRDIHAAIVVIAAGCLSQDVGRIFGIGEASEGPLAFPIPVEPRKRYVYCIRSPNGPGLNCPLVVDPSGAYFRREGLADMYVCGKAPHCDEEPSTEDLSVDDSFFQESVWPHIANRCPSFENLKVHSSWAGFYDYNTFDQNAIIGRHPSFSNLFVATGFSGHGVQQAAGAGCALTELMLDAELKTLDVARLGFERLLLNEPLMENCLY